MIFQPDLFSVAITQRTLLEQYILFRYILFIPAGCYYITEISTVTYIQKDRF